MAAVAAWLLPGCAPPAPPPRPLYVSVWLEAVEDVVADRARAGEAPAVAGPDANATLHAALDAACRRRAVAPEAWAAAVVAHEAAARDEIRRRIGDLARAWRRAVHAPDGMVTDVLDAALPAALERGWEPPPAIAGTLAEASPDALADALARLAAAVPGSIEVTPDPLVDPRARPDPPDAATVAALAGDVTRRLASALAAVADAIPADALGETLTAGGISSRAFAHARAGFVTLPAPAPGSDELPLTFLQDAQTRVRVIEHVGEGLAAWATAGTPAGREKYLERCRHDLRDQVLHELDFGPVPAPFASQTDTDAFAERVLTHVRFRHGSLAQSDVAWRMTERRLREAWTAAARAATFEEVEAARAVAALDAAAVRGAGEEWLAAIKAAPAPPAVPDADPTEGQRQRLAESLARVATAHGWPAGQVPYLRRRLEAEAVTSEMLAQALGS